jgi:two-component system sensor histidine kinase QseC
MRSIRTRLFVVLIITTGLVWLSAVTWIYFSTQAQVEKVLDARLQEAARMVDSLIADRRIDVTSAMKAAVDESGAFTTDTPGYERQLSCQIWSLSGNLVGRSQSAPAQTLATHEDGFQETAINGERWRVYSITDKDLGVRVLVGDTVAVRQKLVDDVAKGLLVPVAFILPVLALLIWLSVGRGLKPLANLAAGLAGRSASDLHPVETTGTPSEIRPVANALNGLFKRLRESREREKNFTAFAAHELKTPLAGLKTQAQIALGTDAPEVRTQALTRIVQAVDRTSRLVRQLLDLTAVEAATEEPDTRQTALSDVVGDVVDGLAQLAAARHVSVDVGPIGDHLVVQQDAGSVSTALRNIVENAVQYAEESTTVRCQVAETGDSVSIHVGDDGPGMRADELARARERFYRGSESGSEKSGSGLGLSIVEAAMNRLGGELLLESREGAGVHVTLRLPAYLLGNLNNPVARP